MLRIRAIIGDITNQSVDAIVNAANEPMLGGGGVDGAIHSAAGPGLYEACLAVSEMSPGVRCPTGEAKITRGFNLPAKWIIHTVGPRWSGGSNEDGQLASCYRSVLSLANEHSIESIAFPAISCGVYRFPPRRAAKIAVTEISEHMQGVTTVVSVTLVTIHKGIHAILSEAIG